MSNLRTCLVIFASYSYHEIVKRLRGSYMYSEASWEDPVRSRLYILEAGAVREFHIVHHGNVPMTVAGGVYDGLHTFGPVNPQILPFCKGRIRPHSKEVK